MSDQLKEIATEVIGELRDLKEQGSTIQGRLAKLDEVGADASKEVVDRVRNDYNNQLADLARTAAPLKQKARVEFGKLTALHDRVAGVAASLDKDKEEIELRHQLGEFEEKDFETRVGEVKQALSTHQKELEQMQNLRDDFVSVFDSEEELMDPAKAVPPPPAPTPEPEPEPTADPIGSAELVVEASTPGDEPALDQPADDFGGTVMLNDEAVGRALAGEGVEGGTTVLPMSVARLEPVDQSDAPQAVHLGPRTVIGRTAENQLQIDQAVVSRRHAEIAQLEDGYRLKDLGSENGTYVNGEQIEELVLSDGDRIQIGSYRYVFHSA